MLLAALTILLISMPVLFLIAIVLFVASVIYEPDKECDEADDVD